MKVSDAYKQWQAMTLSATKIEQDSSIPLWQKSYRIPGAYSGLALDQLRSKHRHRVLNTLKKMNKILAPYQFESFDDYHLMNDKEIQNLILLSKQLAHR